MFICPGILSLLVRGVLIVLFILGIFVSGGHAGRTESKPSVHLVLFFVLTPNPKRQSRIQRGKMNMISNFICMHAFTHSYCHRSTRSHRRHELLLFFLLIHLVVCRWLLVSPVPEHEQIIIKKNVLMTVFLAYPVTMTHQSSQSDLDWIPS